MTAIASPPAAPGRLPTRICGFRSAPDEPVHGLVQGLPLSVGARGKDVMSQFLVDAVALCLLGGLGGIALGYLATDAIARSAGWPALFSTDAMMVAVSVTAGVGLFFGFYPAWKASRLGPIVALRRE